MLNISDLDCGVDSAPLVTAFTSEDAARGTLFIGGGGLRTSAVLIFTVVGSRGGRSSSYSIEVTTVEGVSWLPRVELNLTRGSSGTAPNTIGGQLVDSVEGRLTVVGVAFSSQGICSSLTPRTGSDGVDDGCIALYTWSVTRRGFAGGQNSTLDLSDPRVASSLPGSSFLVLEPNVLVAGGQYSIQLQVTASSGSTGSASILVTANLPPTGGILTRSPERGTQLQSQFEFSQSGWFDDAEHLPLTYSYDTRTTDGWVEGATGECDSDALGWTPLAAGLISSRYATSALIVGSLVVRAVAQDTLGARGCVFGYLTVDEPSALQSNPVNFLSAQVR